MAWGKESYIYNHKAKEVIRGGVYVLYQSGEVVYVGKSKNVYKRIGDHIEEDVKEFDSFDVYETEDRDRLEKFLICLFKPRYNAQSEGSWLGTADELMVSPNLLDKAIEVYNNYIDNEVQTPYNS